MKTLIKKSIIRILEIEARLVLKKYRPKIIAITGSVGKTSTKDMIYTAFSAFANVRKSEKSYNSEFGIPLTVLGAQSGWNNPLAWGRIIMGGCMMILFREVYPEWLILEVGADRPGDIRKIARWIKPDVVVVTRFGDVPVHVEFFDSPEQVIEEKYQLVKALKKDGLLVLNADDEKVLAMRKNIPATVVTYGHAKNALMRVSDVAIMYKDGYPVGTTFKVTHEENILPVRLSCVFGDQYIYPALVALSIGIHQNVNLVKMIELLENHSGSPGRLKLIAGIKGSRIIDDTYNASPVAVEAALATLDEIKTDGKKIAILGDMLELGRYAASEHKKIGILAGQICDLLLVVGLRAKSITEGALIGELSEKNIIEFDNSRLAGKYLEGVLAKHDIVLIKGSQRMRMERAVEEIMAYPEKKEDLLVRQEPEWLARQ